MIMLSCGTERKVVYSNHVKFKDIGIAIKVDTNSYTIELNVTNNTNQTFYIPDTFGYSICRLYGEDIWNALNFYNFIEIYHPPIPIVVKKFLPNETIRLFIKDYNEISFSQLNSKNMKENLKYMEFEISYILLKYIEEEKKSLDEIEIDRLYFETYMNMCPFRINLIDYTDTVRRGKERWDMFDAMNPNNF